MRPASHTDQDVIAAGQQLLAQGKAVTGFGLREVLGGGNSARLKNIWEAQASMHVPAAPAVPLTAELEELFKAAQQKLDAVFRELAMKFHADSHKTATDSAAIAVAEVESKLREAESELAEAQRQADRNTETLESKDEEIRRLKLDLESKADELNQRYASEARTQAAAERLAERNAALQSEQSELLQGNEALKKEVSRLQIEVEKGQEKIDLLTQDVERQKISQKSEAQALRNEISGLNHENKRLIAEAAAQKSRADTLQQLVTEGGKPQKIASNETSTGAEKNTTSGAKKGSTVVRKIPKPAGK